MYFCRVCYSEIKDVRDVCYCAHCRMPFHSSCIESHLKKYLSCPQCRARADMSSMVRGTPPSRVSERQEIQTKQVRVAEIRRMPDVRPTRRIDLSARKKKVNLTPIIVGAILLLVIGGGGYFAFTKLPGIFEVIEQQKPPATEGPTILPTGPPQTAGPGETAPPQTSAPTQGTYFGWLATYMTEWNQGRAFQYSQEIYYSTRTVKSDIRWKMATVVTTGSEKATLTEVSMTTPVTDTTSFESSARRWVGVNSGKCLKVETSTAGKRKEGDCTQSLFGAGIDFEAIPSWEQSATMKGQEEVSVPAGTFTANKAEVAITMDNTPVQVTFWYVEGKPPLKIEVYKEGKLYILYQLVAAT